MHETLIKLHRAGVPFALYRLPGGREPTFVTCAPESFVELDDPARCADRPGFVLAPFAVDREHPVVVIPEERRADGASGIIRLMARLEAELTHGFKKEVAGFDAHERRVGRNHASRKRPEDPGLPLAAMERIAYGRDFNAFMSALRGGNFEKLVLARRRTRPIPAGTDLVSAFITACRRHPEGFVSLTGTPRTGILLGATPEELLTKRGDRFRTMALAGTMAVPPGETPPDWSAKCVREQALVTRHVRDVVRPEADAFAATGPATVRTGGLVHLRTDFDFTLAPGRDPGALAAALHPTPAVCGLPVREALDFITKNESAPRGWYSGFLGSVTRVRGRAELDLYVNLRCASIDPEAGTITLVAGGGLLTDSDEDAEWRETEAKMGAASAFFSDTGEAHGHGTHEAGPPGDASERRLRELLEYYGAEMPCTQGASVDCAGGIDDGIERHGHAASA